MGTCAVNASTNRYPTRLAMRMGPVGSGGVADAVHDVAASSMALMSFRSMQMELLTSMGTRILIQAEHRTNAAPLDTRKLAPEVRCSIGRFSRAVRSTRTSIVVFLFQFVGRRALWLLGGAFLSSIGCSCPPISPHIDSGPMPADIWVYSPIIVAGTIVDVAPAGSATDFEFLGSHLSLRLRRITVDVEKAIEGDLSPGRIEVLMFLYEFETKGRGYAIGPNPFYPVVGQRKIMFLRRENGLLRSWSDVYSMDIELFGGKLQGLVFEQSDTAGDRILRTFLTANADADSGRLAGEITKKLGALIGFGSPKKTVALLRRLTAKGGDLRLRHSACLALAEWFLGEGRCLDEMSGAGDPQFVSNAMRILARNRSNEAGLLWELEHDPFLVPPISPTSRIDYAIEVFELLTEHPSEKVRAASCELVTRLKSRESLPHCRTN